MKDSLVDKQGRKRILSVAELSEVDLCATQWLYAERMPVALSVRSSFGQPKA